MILNRILKKSAAFLLVLWYSFCIIGFDIHTCKASDSQFVSTFVGGFSCKDVHPDHNCSNCSRHIPSADGQSAEYISCTCCCSNLYHSLEVTGSRSYDQDDHNHGICLCGLYPIVTEMLSLSCAFQCQDSIFADIPDSPDEILSGDVLSAFGIWRI